MQTKNNLKNVNYHNDRWTISAGSNKKKTFFFWNTVLHTVHVVDKRTRAWGEAWFIQQIRKLEMPRAIFSTERDLSNSRGSIFLADVDGWTDKDRGNGGITGVNNRCYPFLFSAGFMAASIRYLYNIVPVDI